MMNLILISAFLMALLVLVKAAPAAEGIVTPIPKTIMFNLPKSKPNQQCTILNRTSPNFERELLSVPPDACVIVIGSWIIKTNFFFIPTEIVSSKNEVWQVTWKDLNSPLVVGNKTWDVKLTTQGMKQFMASVSYRF